MAALGVHGICSDDRASDVLPPPAASGNIGISFVLVPTPGLAQDHAMGVIEGSQQVIPGFSRDAGAAQAFAIDRDDPPLLRHWQGGLDYQAADSSSKA